MAVNRRKRAEVLRLLNLPPVVVPKPLPNPLPLAELVRLAGAQGLVRL